MKRDLIYLTLLAALFAAAKVMAQNDETTSQQELTPRTIEVGFTKTVHILFPAPVTYIDIGSMAERNRATAYWTSGQGPD